MTFVHAFDFIHGLVEVFNLVVGVVRVLLPSIGLIRVELRHVWIGLQELLLDFQPLNDQLLHAEFARLATRLINEVLHIEFGGFLDLAYCVVGLDADQADFSDGRLRALLLGCLRLVIFL